MRPSKLSLIAFYNMLHIHAAVVSYVLPHLMDSHCSCALRVRQASLPSESLDTQMVSADVVPPAAPRKPVPSHAPSASPMWRIDGAGLALPIKPSASPQLSGVPHIAAVPKAVVPAGASLSAYSSMPSTLQPPGMPPATAANQAVVSSGAASIGQAPSPSLPGVPEGPPAKTSPVKIEKGIEEETGCCNISMACRLTGMCKCT